MNDDHLPIIMGRLNAAVEILLDRDGFELTEIVDGLRAFTEAAEMAARPMAEDREKMN